MRVTKRITAVYALSIVIAAGVFILDLSTPLGYAVWLGYLPSLIITSLRLNRWFVYALSSVCTVFIVLGFIHPPPGINPNIALLNIFLAVCTLWVATIFIIKHKRAEERIREQAELLDQTPRCH